MSDTPSLPEAATPSPTPTPEPTETPTVPETPTPPTPTPTPIALFSFSEAPRRNKVCALALARVHVRPDPASPATLHDVLLATYKSNLVVWDGIRSDRPIRIGELSGNTNSATSEIYSLYSVTPSDLTDAGSLLLAASTDGSISRWDLLSGIVEPGGYRYINVNPVYAVPAAIYSLAVHAPSESDATSLILTGGADRAVHVLKMGADFTRCLPMNAAPAPAVDTTAMVTPVATSATATATSGTIWTIAVSPDGKYACAGCLNGGIAAIELSSKETEKFVLPADSKGNPDGVLCLQFVSNDRVILGTKRGFLYTLRLPAGESPPKRIYLTDDYAHRSSTGGESVICMQYSAKRHLLATGGSDGQVRLWTVRTPDVIENAAMSQAVEPAGVAPFMMPDHEGVRSLLLDDSGDTSDLWIYAGGLEYDQIVRFWLKAPLTTAPAPDPPPSRASERRGTPKRSGNRGEYPLFRASCRSASLPRRTISEQG